MGRGDAAGKNTRGGTAGADFVNDLIAGLVGGQTIIGGTAAGDNLTLKSTSHATKGKILIGTMGAWDEVNGRLGVGTQSPTVTGHFVNATANATITIEASTDAATIAATYNWKVGANLIGALSAQGALFTPSGALKASSLVLNCIRDGGVSIAASNAAGDIRLYTGGSADANLRLTIDQDGVLTSTAAGAATVTVTDAQSIGLTSSGVTAVGFGTALVIRSQTGSTAVDAVKLRTTWYEGAAGSHRMQFAIGVATAGAVPAVGSEQYRFPGDGYMRLTGGVLVDATTVNNPNVSCSSDTNTGFAFLGADDLSISIGGVSGMQVSPPTVDLETAMLVRRNLAGVFSLVRVTLGAADSAGAGFRTLRVVN